jgi:sulfate adenylyltransferase
MFYSGPREAAHHANIRERLGFDYFIVGRDHAGAENFYPKNASSKLLTKHKNKFKIKIIPIKAVTFVKHIIR